MREIRIQKSPDELSIAIRWISRIKGVLLLAILLPVLALLVWSTRYYLLGVLFGYIALVFGLNWTRLRIVNGELMVSVGPIPFPAGRKKVAAQEIREVSVIKVRVATGRGGRAERYTLQVQTRDGRKPEPLMDGEREPDIREAAQALVDWLNSRRPAGERVQGPS